jgi:hypothetical protein
MLRRLSIVAASLAALAACQGYRFKAVDAQPVQVVNQQVTVPAKQKPPDIMIVQDTSGSMCEPIQLDDGTNGTTGNSCLATAEPPTGSGVGYCSFCQEGYSSSAVTNTAADCNFGGSTLPACATKMQLTANAMINVLQSLKPAVGELNIGLASFANSDSCNGGVIQVAVGDAVTTIPQIVAFYQGVSPNGGTPTDATLQLAAADPTLTNPDPTAQKFILLVTDGLPNCAATSPCTTEAWSNGTSYGCSSPSEVDTMFSVNVSPPTTCTCSFGPCSPGQNSNFCCPPGAIGTTEEAWYCLDDVSTEAELTKLYTTQSIKTDVIGMGYDYSSNPTILTAMAAAGHGTLFQANSPAALTSSITGLIHSLTAQCNYTLDAAPVNPGLISVTLNSVPLVAGDPNGYTFTPPTSLSINGSACAALQSMGSTPEILQITAIAN